MTAWLDPPAAPKRQDFTNATKPALLALRAAIARNMENPTPENRAECSRLGLAYRKAVETWNARERLERQIDEALRAATQLDPLETPERVTPPALSKRGGVLSVLCALVFILCGGLVGRSCEQARSQHHDDANHHQK